MLTHRNMLANVLQAQVWAGDALVQLAHVNVTMLPLYHVFSLTVNCLMCYAMGSRNILIANPRDTRRMVKALRHEKFTEIVGINTLFRELLENEEFRARDFSSLRLTVAGGMPLQKAVAERWRQVTGMPIIEGYGLTECAPVVSLCPLDIAEKEHDGFSGTAGLPLPSTEVRMRRMEGGWAGPGEEGEVCVRGPQVMAGYWGRPDETARVLDSEGWLATGDIGVMEPNGAIRLIDRIKDMILVSGFNVYPAEIEDVVMLHPGVRECAAFGIADAKCGERVKLVVVPRGPLTEAEILAHCRRYLTGYKIPKIVEFRTAPLPKSNVGKVLRRVLREEKAALH
jgi:long-chain acyl-CoA synthetase